MQVLSIDLAKKSYRDNGFVVLDQNGSKIRAAVASPLEFSNDEMAAPESASFAKAIDGFCGNRGITALVLDGPQAWKCPANGLEHSRVCERALNTQGKAGLPNRCKPGNYLGFIAFSIDVFGILQEMGWRLAGPNAPQDPTAKMLFESYPNASWAGLGLPCLGAKRRCTDSRKAEFRDCLGRKGVEIKGSPSHDDLQAVVGGLGALSFIQGQQRHRFEGCSPFVRDGVLREGYIIVPEKF